MADLLKKATLNAISLFGTVFFVSLFSGCSSHPTLGYIESIEKGQSLDLQSLYIDDIKDNSLDIELCLMEKGRIAQMQGDYQASRDSFNEEIELLRKRELDDNTLPGPEINIGSVLVNDNLLPYKARLFEVEMLRLFQCFNYLGMGSLEGAIVEIRNAEFILNEAEKARESEDFKEEGFRESENSVNKKLFESQNETPPASVSESTTKDSENKGPESQSITPSESVAEPAKTAPASSGAKKKETKTRYDKTERAKYEQQGMKEYDQYFAEMAEILAKSKSSVLNPYVLFVGGVVHEMCGEEDHAYISYKKGLEVMPSNPYICQNVIRLARKLDRTNDYDELKNAYPEAWSQAESFSPPSKEEGRLVILYEDGWAPRKEEEFITLAAVAIAYPVYRFKWCDATPMLVSSQTGDIGLTAPVCHMNAIALRALKEESKWRVIRQAARLVVKGGTFAAGATMAAASDNSAVQLAGVGVMIASMIYNNASENADLRSWMTLPENAQILIAQLQAGEHSIVFSPQKSQLRLEERVPIKAGETTIIRVVHVGSRLLCQRLWPQN